MAQTWAESLVEEGRLQAQQKYLVLTLTEKFGALSQQTEARIRAIQDETALEALFRQALRARSLSDVELE